MEDYDYECLYDWNEEDIPDYDDEPEDPEDEDNFLCFLNGKPVYKSQTYDLY